jgi:hypothetical protein
MPVGSERVQPLPMPALEITMSTNVATASQMEPLQLDHLRVMIQEATETSNWSPLMHAIYAVFTSLSLLSKSFCRSSTRPERRTDGHQAKEAFWLIVSQCPQTIINCLSSAISCLFDKLKLGQETIQSDNLSVFLILLQNPLLLDSTNHATVVIRLCEFISRLSQQDKLVLGQMTVEAWMPPDNPNHAKQILNTMPGVKKMVQMGFQGFVSIFQHFITMRTYINAMKFGLPVALNKDEPIMNATRCLAILRKFYS